MMNFTIANISYDDLIKDESMKEKVMTGISRALSKSVDADFTASVTFKNGSLMVLITLVPASGVTVHQIGTLVAANTTGFMNEVVSTLGEIPGINTVMRGDISIAGVQTSLATREWARCSWATKGTGYCWAGGLQESKGWRLDVWKSGDEFEAKDECCAESACA